MKKVSVRAFQLKPYEYLKELPVMLTRYGEDIAVIDTAKNIQDVDSSHIKHIENYLKVTEMPQSFGGKK